MFLGCDLMEVKSPPIQEATEMTKSLVISVGDKQDGIGSRLNKENTVIRNGGHVAYTPLGVALERQKLDKCTAAFYCILMIGFEIAKQLTSYAVLHQNNKHYPLPQTAIVAIIEFVKLAFIGIVLVWQNNFTKIKMSFLFAVPSVLFALNNNVYYYAFYFTTPPIWIILTQIRILFTAFVYRFLFKRQITWLQWAGLLVLIFGIVLTKVAAGHGVVKNLLSPMAIILSLMAAVISVSASILMEFLFKNDKRSFVEQQSQLYLFGFLVSLCLLIGEKYNTKETFCLEKIKDIPMNIKILLILSILFSAGGGLSVALIMKKMDNIVKAYNQSLSNLFTAVGCSLLFPKQFTLDSSFLFSLALVCVGIFLYEKKVISFSREAEEP